MASEQSNSTSDLRAGSIDYQRDHEQKAKWANGGAWGPGRPLNSNPRPVRISHRVAAAHRREKAKEVAHAARSRKHEVFPMDHYTSGESTDDEPIESSAAPEPDAGITYSFDAEKGPSHGSQILNQALVQAIERFEDRKTHELVNEEYEVLDGNGEPANLRGRAGKGKRAAKGEDDDREHI